jgi:hypothetical protein
MNNSWIPLLTPLREEKKPAQLCADCKTAPRYCVGSYCPACKRVRDREALRRLRARQKEAAV